MAHDNRKKDLIEWVQYNREILREHHLVCTGTTGKLVEEAMNADNSDIKNLCAVRKLKSGPLGGDQQIGAMIAEGEIDLIIFLWDPMEPQPHDVDVKALLRMCVLYNIPTACNRSTADFMISSAIFHSEYEPIVKDYNEYRTRMVVM